MSDLPGTPQDRIDPFTLRDQLADLTIQVSRFIASQEPLTSPVTAIGYQPKCFIIMPFGITDLENFYTEFVLPVLHGCKLNCTRGDDIFGSNVIMEDVRSAIAAADLVVADLTGQNPNVFYEVGIAHTMGKQVLLLSQSINDVPFDLRHRRVLSYQYTPVGCKKFVAKLREHVMTILGVGV